MNFKLIERSCLILKKGRVIKLYRNYGVILCEGEEFPFLYTKEMLVSDKNYECIKYSEYCEFSVKTEEIRGENIKIAENIQFEKNLNYEARAKSDNYLNIIKSFLSRFSLTLPSVENMRIELEGLNDSIDDELMEKIKTLPLDEILSMESKTDDDIYYEWLKIEGFQPYMIEYFSDDILGKSNIKRLIDGNDLSIDLIVEMDRFDKILRSNLLNWILGIENSYKSLISRLCRNAENSIKIGERIVDDWANSSYEIRKGQIKRAKKRCIFSPLSDQYDYINNDERVHLEDLLEQLDLSSLEVLFKKFNEYSKGEKQNLISPWIHIAESRVSLFKNLNLLRNSAAHDRLVLPKLFGGIINNEHAISTTWELFDEVKIYLESHDATFNKNNYINRLKDNVYRKAWFEMVYIYWGLISLFDSNQFAKFEEEIKVFLNQFDYNELLIQNWQKQQIDKKNKDVKKAIINEFIKELKMDYCISKSVAEKNVLNSLNNLYKLI